MIFHDKPFEIIKPTIIGLESAPIPTKTCARLIKKPGFSLCKSPIKAFTILSMNPKNPPINIIITDATKKFGDIGKRARVMVKPNTAVNIINFFPNLSAAIPPVL